MLLDPSWILLPSQVLEPPGPELRGERGKSHTHRTCSVMCCVLSGTHIILLVPRLTLRKVVEDSPFFLITTEETGSGRELLCPRAEPGPALSNPYS